MKKRTKICSRLWKLKIFGVICTFSTFKGEKNVNDPIFSLWIYISMYWKLFIETDEELTKNCFKFLDPFYFWVKIPIKSNGILSLGLRPRLR